MKRIMFIAFLAITLVACAPAHPNETDVVNTAIAKAQTSVPLTQTALSTTTPTATTVFPTPSQIPTQPPPPILTPDGNQVEHWKEYQTELAKVLLALTERGQDPTIYKDALCEWDILGQSGQEVYVYAVCVVFNGNTDMRSPAIIYLKPSGSIQQVKLPELKPNSDMFDYDPYPKEVQDKFCFYFNPFVNERPVCPVVYTALPPRLNILYAHLEFRKTNPDIPPLVILSAISTATPTP